VVGGRRVSAALSDPHRGWFSLFFLCLQRNVDLC
jgi:hypothetical protein